MCIFLLQRTTNENNRVSKKNIAYLFLTQYSFSVYRCEIGHAALSQRLLEITFSVPLPLWVHSMLYQLSLAPSSKYLHKLC